MNELNLLKKTFKKKLSKKNIKILENKENTEFIKKKHISNFKRITKKNINTLLNKKKTHFFKRKYISVYKKIYKVNTNTCNRNFIPDKLKLYSNLCYYSYKQEKPKKYKNYKLDENYNTKYYQCYYNKNKCIIVFRGTKLDKRDLIMDFYISFNSMEKNKYFEKLLTISKEIIEKYNKKKIILTGHSLGGSISLFVMNSLKSKIHKTYVFNPGIAILPYKQSILKEYCSNEKNYFIIKLGDIISNSIFKHKPKNLICLNSDIYDNIINLHKISCFL